MPQSWVPSPSTVPLTPCPAGTTMFPEAPPPQEKGLHLSKKSFLPPESSVFWRQQKEVPAGPGPHLKPSFTGSVSLTASSFPETQNLDLGRLFSRDYLPLPGCVLERPQAMPRVAPWKHPHALSAEYRARWALHTDRPHGSVNSVPVMGRGAHGHVISLWILPTFKFYLRSLTATPSVRIMGECRTRYPPFS